MRCCGFLCSLLCSPRLGEYHLCCVYTLLDSFSERGVGNVGSLDTSLERLYSEHVEHFWFQRYSVDIDHNLSHWTRREIEKWIRCLHSGIAMDQSVGLPQSGKQGYGNFHHGLVTNSVRHSVFLACSGSVCIHVWRYVSHCASR